MKRGAHLRVDPRRVVAERLVWTGLSLIGLSVLALGLYAVYQTLSGTFTGAAATLATGPITVTLVVLVIGLALSGVGTMAASRIGKQGRTIRREDSRPKIAA